jgi:galactose oxidase-like protein/List-Bact-rpt repeat protein
MLRQTRLPPGVTLLLVLTLGSLILHACQEADRATRPSAVTALVQYHLTISAVGTGSGVVTSSPAGIDCTITGGALAASGCNALFNQGLTVALTARPVAGHGFGGWSQACSGTATCVVTMTAARAVSAQFLIGPFTVRIASTGSGGSGRVTSQTGLTPAIHCVITNGTVAATGCSGRYPAYTPVLLTATPTPGNSFVGWTTHCSGTGKCSVVLNKNRTVTASFATSSRADQGEWSPPFPWPIVGVHLHLLRTGEVLSFGKQGTPRVWNISTGQFRSVWSSYLMFCGGHAFLPDGRLLLTGGNISHDRGLPYASIFDPGVRTLTRLPAMAQGRWYPTNTTLADGEVLTAGGADENAVIVGIPEVWNGASWRKLSAANLPLPYYPWLFQSANGRVFYAGPSTSTRYLDTRGAGSWGPVVARSSYGARSAGTAVMYQPGKVLIAGGGGGTDTTLPTPTAETIDLTSSSPAWHRTGSMAFARRHLNATLLPTGEVLVVGGASGPGWNNAAATVHEAELWNPVTGIWKVLARNTINRIYHSAAILLPDARVLVTGAGARSQDVDQLNAELYSPPYLFKGTRPTLTGVAATLSYGTSFPVTTPNGASIAKVTLLRLGSVTHSFDENQRFIALDFRQTATGLSVTAPASANLAPPGHYMLFLVNGNGVPSIARIVRLG